MFTFIFDFRSLLVSNQLQPINCFKNWFCFSLFLRRPYFLEFVSSKCLLKTLYATTKPSVPSQCISNNIISQYKHLVYLFVGISDMGYQQQLPHASCASKHDHQDHGLLLSYNCHMHHVHLNMTIRTMAYFCHTIATCIMCI